MKIVTSFFFSFCFAEEKQTTKHETRKLHIDGSKKAFNLSSNLTDGLYVIHSKYVRMHLIIFNLCIDCVSCRRREFIDAHSSHCVAYFKTLRLSFANKQKKS